MNIIILCKRRPQGKDLWLRPHGRFYHLALGLAERGHQVDLVLLNYRREPEFTRRRDGLAWHSVNLLPNPLAIFLYARALVATHKADWVIGFSDTWFGILAVLVARLGQCRSLVDAYDNYESYLPWCKPLHWLWRAALRRADCVTAPGEHLLRRMSQGRRPGSACGVLPMAADPQFSPVDKMLARQQLHLPAAKKLVGYCGSAHGTRDMGGFFNAMERLLVHHPDYAVVMTGRVQPGIALPPGVIHLGYLPDEHMVQMVGALDVMVAANRPSAFGSFSYPVKMYEALACGVPVVAFDTPSVAEVLAFAPGLRVAPGNADALAVAVEGVLEGHQMPVIPPAAGWGPVARRLETLLAQG